MRGIKAALFDLYDTLTYVDKRRLQEKIAKCAAICEVSAEKFSSAWRGFYIQSTLGVYPRTEDRVQAVLDKLEIRGTSEIIREVTAYEHDFLKTGMMLFEDAIDTLDSLKAAGLKIGLVTNASPSVRVLIKRHRLDEHLDTVIVSSEVNCRKPAEGIYKAALEALKVAPHQGVFVGDGNDNELEGARKLGITTIWINRGIPKYQKEENPTGGFDLRAESLHQVKRIIMSMINIQK